ncbi:MAG: hypothetical protein LKF79_08545 [Solobacterium sp.]|jgi:uncharacterized membrane protein|nr:hypothetical protein [Solobacterium sp.]MCH4223339.1 hypothetical protein [Solobacterium sp.]MCH4266676.1 hypothetical protein [Solobacterium sp.]
MTFDENKEFHLTAANDTTRKLANMIAWIDIGVFAFLAVIYTILMSNEESFFTVSSNGWIGYLLAVLFSLPGVYLLLYMHNWKLDIKDGNITRTSALGAHKVLGSVSEMAECHEQDHQVSVYSEEALLFSFSFLNGGDTIDLYQELFGHAPQVPQADN